MVTDCPVIHHELWNHYRAYQPWPGYFCGCGKRYKITAARWEDDRFVCAAIQPEGNVRCH